MSFITRAGREYGWVLGVLGFVLAIAMLVGYGQAVNKPPPGIPAGDKVVVAPATGVESFDATQFCQDPQTAIKQFPAPDTSGLTYQLVRVRDSKTESVVVVLDGTKAVKLATHYYDTEAGQQSQPAIIGQEALGCIEKKAKG